jgi:hypothetical protein
MMKYLISTIALFPLLSFAENQDLLLFENGDQLHGEFHGIADGSDLLWKRQKSEEEKIQFNSTDICKVVLRGGKPERAESTHSYVGTSNGDRVSGTVQEVDEKRVIIQTEFAGLIEVPREHVGIIAPNPLGGKVLYYSSYKKEDWEQLDSKMRTSARLPEPKPNANQEEAVWKFSGSAWYWQHERPSSALVRKTGMPSRSILQFDLAWKNRLSIAIAFHADFKPFEPKENGQQDPFDGGRSSYVGNLPEVFGSSYVLHLYSNYLVLYRAGFTEDGAPIMERMQSKNANLRLENTSNAKIEIRCNRDTGVIMLYVDEQFVSEWNEGPMTKDDAGKATDGYRAPGEGFGFISQVEGSAVRVSDVVVAEWNGIPDSARSLESDDNDIVLLNNGRDRFSGKLNHIKDGKASLTGRYGNFSFPISEIAEIRFAKSQLAEIEQDPKSSVKVRFYPLGSISGKLVSGDPNKITINHPSIGDVNIDLTSAFMLEFKPAQSYLDDWNAEF